MCQPFVIFFCSKGEILWKNRKYPDNTDFKESQIHTVLSEIVLTETLLHIFRIFDKDDDGLISVDELRHIMLSFGEKMTEKELDEMISEANCDKDGHIDYDGMYFLNISFG